MEIYKITQNQIEKSKIEPTDKQIDYCHILAERGQLTFPCLEDGTPIFETSMEEADKFIKKHKKGKWIDRGDNINQPEDWGIPNH